MENALLVGTFSPKELDFSAIVLSASETALGTSIPITGEGATADAVIT